MERKLANAVLRPMRLDDADSIARHMNDREVWRNLRDRVPFPYSVDDARAFLVTVVDVVPQRIWAIDVGGEAVGGIGLHGKEDVYRRSLEIGFWLGRAHWGKGIVSEAVEVVVEHGFEEWQDIVRIQAEVFAWNARSQRVLEKAGFVLEGRMRSAVWKGEVLTDLLVFGRVRSE